MTLEEIKNAVVAEVEKVWHELTGTVDVDKARQVIADSAATLTTHVSALGQHLFDHVLGNAEAAKADPAGEAPVQAGAPIPVPADGTPSAVGVASNPSVPGQPDAAPLEEAPTVELADGGHVAGDSNPGTVDDASQGS